MSLLFCLQANLYAQKADFKHIDFSKADSIANLYPKYSLYELPALASKLTATLPTAVEQFRALYKWVTTNIENDYSYFLKNQRKRKKYYKKPGKFRIWNNEFAVKAYKRLLKEQKTVCTGYAALLVELAYFAGLEVAVVNGYGKTAASNILTKDLPNHSWNAVKLNNKWYLCDPTWSAGRIYTDSRGFQFEYFDGYFLTEPKLFALNHFPLEEKWDLSDSRKSLEEFMDSHIVYRSAIDHQLLLEAPEQFKLTISVTDTIHFRLKQLNSEGTDLNLTLKINKGESTLETVKGFRKPAPDAYVLDYACTRKGKYILHLMHEEEYLYSLEVVGE